MLSTSCRHRDVGAGRGDGERGQLAHVVGMRDRAGLFQQPVFGLVLDGEQRQRPVLVKLVAEAGIVEPVHQVLDVEGGEAKRHGRDLCPQAPPKTRAARPARRTAGISVHPAFRQAADNFGVSFGSRAWGYVRFLEDNNEPAILLASRSGLIALGVLAGLSAPAAAAPSRALNAPQSAGSFGEPARRRPGPLPSLLWLWRLLRPPPSAIQILERRLALPPPLSPLLPALWAAALFRPRGPGLPLLRPTAQILSPAPRLCACRLVL